MKITVNYTPEQIASINAQKKANRKASKAKRMEMKKKISESGWKLFEGEELPESARYHTHNFGSDTKPHDIFTYNGQWIIGYTYYHGESPETATKWIVTTDNGGMYKHNAIAMIWQIGFGGSQCVWSLASLKRSIKSLMTTGHTVPDPGYTT